MYTETSSIEQQVDPGRLLKSFDEDVLDDGMPVVEFRRIYPFRKRRCDRITERDKLFNDEVVLAEECCVHARQVVDDLESRFEFLRMCPNDQAGTQNLCIAGQLPFQIWNQVCLQDVAICAHNPW